MQSKVKRLSLILRVNVVLNRTVVVDSDWRFDNLCGSHLQSQSELCHVSWWYYTLVIDLIETIARILQPYNIRVVHKPITTLRRLLTNVKDKDKPEDRQGAVYKIKCCDCQASYIGETGRNLSTRLTEHKRATRNGDVNNHIAEHHLRCFDTVFQTPYRYFSIALKVIFSLSDRCKIFTSNWLWIEICQNVCFN